MEQRTQKIPKDKTVSAYAVEKEQTFKPNSTVLDLGGGLGVDAIYFAQKGHTVYLADISDYALKTATEKAQANNLEIQTNQINLEKDALPYDDKVASGAKVFLLNEVTWTRA